MRPLHREPPRSGNASFEPDYKRARPDLRDNFGDFCCYCEVKLPTGQQVDHVLPKSRYPELIFCWDNLLLACSTCNEKKGVNEFAFRPDRDNTFLAFSYEEGIGVAPNSEVLTEDQRRQAQVIIDILGLSRDLNIAKATKRTSRIELWEDRDRTWESAALCKKRLQSIYEKQEPNVIEEMKKDILDRAQDYFSVWMTVFADDPDMRRRFIKKFKGTAIDCFDADGAPIPRPGGKI